MSDSPPGELGILASLTAAIEATQVEIADIDIRVGEDGCRGTVQMQIPLKDVTGVEHVRVETGGFRLSDTELRFDLEVDIPTTDATAVNASESETAGHDEIRTDPSEEGTRTLPDQSVQRTDPNSGDESIEEHGSGDRSDRTDHANRLNVELDKDTKTNDTTADTPVRSSQARSDVDDSAGGETVSEGDRPRYRDPEELAAVYDKSATFNEMRDELGVDVTAQTVRKYMIEYGIHEPKPRPDRLLETIRASELELMNSEHADQTERRDDSSQTDSENADSEDADR